MSNDFAALVIKGQLVESFTNEKFPNRVVMEISKEEAQRILTFLNHCFEMERKENEQENSKSST